MVATKWLRIVSFLLVTIGAINWGLWALFDLNLVSLLVGSWPMVEKLTYVLVGASGLYMLVMGLQDPKMWK